MNRRQARSRNVLACIGDASRFRLVLALLERERCVTELASDVGLSQSCTTRHLQYLEREGLVRGARQGKRVMFRLRSDDPRVRGLLSWVTASSPEAIRHEISGAELHIDRRPANGGRAGRPVAGGRPRERMARRVRQAVAGTGLEAGVQRPRSKRPRDRQPAVDEATTAYSDRPIATDDAGGADAVASRPDTRDDATPVVPRSSEMEDWLL